MANPKGENASASGSSRLAVSDAQAGGFARACHMSSLLGSLDSVAANGATELIEHARREIDERVSEVAEEIRTVQDANTYDYLRAGRRLRGEQRADLAESWGQSHAFVGEMLR